MLADAAGDVFASFADHVLACDAAAADHYGDVAAKRNQVGAPISRFDAQIAAICRSRDTALATRNTDDFTRLAIELIDP